MISETWLYASDSAPLIESSHPQNLSFFSRPWLSGRGGGLAVVYDNIFNCSLIYLGDFSSFKSLCFTIRENLKSVYFNLQTFKFVSGFLEQFSELQSIVMLSYDRILIANCTIQAEKTL